MIRVLIADDEALMRSGLRLMIDGTHGISVVAEACNGEEAIALAVQHQPDVVLMDVRMPRMDGIQATAHITGGAPTGHNPARVIVLTAFDTDDYLLQALRAGAVSFLLKDSPPEAVVEAVQSAASGEARFSPTVLHRLVRLAAEEKVTSPPVRPRDITEREWAVGELIAQGMTNAEIATELFVSLATVKTHAGHLFDKLGVTNRVQLAIRILELSQTDRVNLEQTG